jgi:UDP-N-acetylmuramoyl-L-alanyl-D-glutamate--2,6-diaminopimelate ligase
LKLLSDIIKGLKSNEISGSISVEISGIAFDSREVKPGFLFVAVKGTHVDGHDYIQKALQLGAIALICEKMPQNTADFKSCIRVADSSFALGIAASNWYGNPSAKLKLTGVTGTNGKTTTVTLLFNMFRRLGYHVGLLSTIANRIDDQVIASTHTTPDAMELNQLLSQIVDTGCTHVFMEVSSHSIVQNRIAGLTFRGGVFTNITHDHLDFHKTFAEYLKAKKLFFDTLPVDAFALTNIDDRNGKVMLQNTLASQKTYSLHAIADFKGRILETQVDGIHIDLDGIDVWCRLVGAFNGYNLLAVYATALLLGEDREKVMEALSTLEPVEGRFDNLKSRDGIIAVIDYAHTPDALENVLETITKLRRRGQTLITVVGCGGDRDRTKRPIMLKIACDMSDKVVVTADNPRSEEPEAIIDDMMLGLDELRKKKVLRIVDRREAIRTSCSLAKPGDIILVAGKGHEKYQEIKGVKYPFDDKMVIKEALEL